MSTLNTPSNQALALAGILQSTFLCKNLANYGRCDADQLSASLNSVLQLDAPTVNAVYGSARELSKGLRLLCGQLGSGNERDLDLSRYSVALIQLGDNVMSDGKTMAQLHTSIQRASQLDLHILDNTMINSLADTYRTCISHLSPRIMVSGQPEYLNNELVAAKIRASLLAGLRSVVLWRQCGGTRPGLLFGRGRYVREATALLN